MSSATLTSPSSLPSSSSYDLTRTTHLTTIPQPQPKPHRLAPAPPTLTLGKPGGPAAAAPDGPTPTHTASTHTCVWRTTTQYEYLSRLTTLVRTYQAHQTGESLLARSPARCDHAAETRQPHATLHDLALRRSSFFGFTCGSNSLAIPLPPSTLSLLDSVSIPATPPPPRHHLVTVRPPSRPHHTTPTRALSATARSPRLPLQRSPLPLLFSYRTSLPHSTPPLIRS